MEDKKRMLEIATRLRDEHPEETSEELAQRIIDEILDEEGRDHWVREQPRQLAPDIGDLFHFIRKDDTFGHHGFRVDGWFRLEGTKIIHCSREDATHVGGAGVCGCIVRVADIVVDGRVPWSEEVIESYRASAIRRIGEKVF